MGSSSENKDLFFYFLRATDPGFKFHSTFTQSEGLPVLSIVRDVILSSLLWSRCPEYCKLHFPPEGGKSLT